MFAGKTILVVGGNGALGAEFCDQLSHLGANVLGTARNAETSARLKSDLGARLLLDLESPVSITALTNYLLALPTHIDGIILASGLVAFGSVNETPISVTSRLMQVNALGQMQLVQELLPKLQESASAGKSPFVISISGVISEKPMAGLASYSASKTALHGYVLAASKEFKKLGITWLDARPGHTETGLAGRAIFGTAPNFGAGLSSAFVVRRILDGIANSETDIPSTAFQL
jgi:NAD(P)-dependent dehydrogenase (short-subunit alcohol dehydrogenase family)